MPYLLGKSRFRINFFTKRNTILLYINQVFIFLQDHLHFFLHLFFTLTEQLFLDDPIPELGKGTNDHLLPLGDWFPPFPPLLHIPLLVT